MTDENITRYVCGFLFSKDRKKVALILKNRPQQQAGRYSVIGGKVRAGETPGASTLQARFSETVGVEITDWEHYALLQNKNEHIHFFRAFWPETHPPELQHLTDELPTWVRVDNEFDVCVSHVEHLIKHALCGKPGLLIYGTMR